MTVVLFNSFGTGASNTLVGDERLGYLTITTGSSPSTGVIRFGYSATILLTSPCLTILPLDSGTAALDLSSSGPSGFTEYSLVVGSLTAATTYSWALRIG